MKNRKVLTKWQLHTLPFLLLNPTIEAASKQSGVSAKQIFDWLNQLHFSEELIGIGKPRDTQHQRQLEARARDDFYVSGGDKGAYLAFLPFGCFAASFIGYIRRSQLDLMITNKTKKPAACS